MTETPRFVLYAVKAYIKEGKKQALCNLFKHGIKLHEYPESRELMINLINQKPIRKRGEKLADIDQEDIVYGAVIYCAQLYGAGLPLFGEPSKSNPNKPYASELAAKDAGLNHEHFYKKIWKKYCNQPEVQQNIALGKRLGLSVVMVDV